MKIVKFLFLFILVSGCSYTFPEQDEKTDSFEGSDFSRFFVIGDGFSSGLMDGVLISNKQKYSFPNILGEKINGYYEADIFLQPMVESNHGYNIFEEGVKGYYELIWELGQSDYPIRRTAEGEPLDLWEGPVDFLKNYSVPGLRSYQIARERDQIENIYADRLPVKSGNSIADQVINANPSVVLISQGLSDLTGYLLHGASGEIHSDPQSISNIDLTAFELYRDSMGDLIARLLMETETQVILSTVPNPMMGPYFTTVPYHMNLGFDITHAEIGLLNTYYREFNNHVRDYNLSEENGERPFIDFDVDGGDRFRARVIEDPTLQEVILEDGSELPKIRQMNEEEILAYSFLTHYAENDQYGKIDPIADEYVLTEGQQSLFRNVLDEYNEWLRIQASNHNRIYLFDISKIIQKVSDGEVLLNGVNFDVDFSRDGIYSTDGVFLNPRGQAILANELIQLINREFDLAIQTVDVNSYPGTKFSIQ